MGRHSTKIIKAALSALHYSGADSLIAPYTAGSGVIFMLHRVTPELPLEFEPNRILKVTPDFLDSVISQVKAADFDIIAIDEVPERLNSPSDKPFAVFTLDDGYRDNLEYAYPVFKRHNVPFTIYIPTDYIDGTGDLWWLVLEEALRRLDTAFVEIDGVPRSFKLSTGPEKDAAFHAIYWWLRGLPESQARAITHRLAMQATFSGDDLCRRLIMTWDEVRTLAADPLVTIGAHGTRHMALAKLSDDDVHAEIVDSVERIERELSMPCRHFSYPYGSEDTAGEREFTMVRELGLKTAVTTRKGLLRDKHIDTLSALPRLSLNGDFQDPRYVKVLLSGAPFALLSALQKVSAPLRTTASRSA